MIFKSSSILEIYQWAKHWMFSIYFEVLMVFWYQVELLPLIVDLHLVTITHWCWWWQLYLSLASVLAPDLGEVTWVEKHGWCHKLKWSALIILILFLPKLSQMLGRKSKTFPNTASIKISASLLEGCNEKYMRFPTEQQLEEAKEK